MKKTAKRSCEKGGSHIVGDSAFAAITAVEGLSLSEASRERLALLRRRKLSADEQRAEVIRAYSAASRKASASSRKRELSAGEQRAEAFCADTETESR